MCLWIRRIQEERLAFMLEDSQGSVLLTQQSTIEDRRWRPVLSEAEDGRWRSSILNPRSSFNEGGLP